MKVYVRLSCATSEFIKTEAILHRMILLYCIRSAITQDTLIIHILVARTQFIPPWRLQVHAFIICVLTSQVAQAMGDVI